MNWCEFYGSMHVFSILEFFLFDIYDLHCNHIVCCHYNTINEWLCVFVYTYTGIIVYVMMCEFCASDSTVNKIISELIFCSWFNAFDDLYYFCYQLFNISTRFLFQWIVHRECMIGYCEQYKINYYQYMNQFFNCIWS